MKLKERIKVDFTEAYKTKDMSKKNFLGVVITAIDTKFDKNVESKDEDVLKVLKSIEKSINETIQGLTKLGSDTTQMETELGYIKQYLPEVMSEDKVREAVRLVIIESGSKNIGMLMGLFTKTYKGADMNMVKKIFTEELA